VKTATRTSITSLVSIVLCLPAAAGDHDLLKALAAGEVENARINLNPWGAHLGVEIDIEGDDPELEALLSVLSSAEPSRGHKCANRGAIRFRLRGGQLIALGLLPSHSEGSYLYRLYDGVHLEGVFSVQRDALLDALGALGVPVDDPAFEN
jgi:hypothetical protein